MCSYGPPHMAGQKQDDKLEHTFSSYVRIRDVALKTSQRRWIIGRYGERWSGISVLAARHDDDDCDVAAQNIKQGTTRTPTENYAWGLFFFMITYFFRFQWNDCPVGWGCRIHRPLLFLKQVSWYDTKQSDDEAQVILELRRMQSTHSLSSPPSQIWPRVVAPYQVMPKPQKMVYDAALLSTQNYKVKIKEKWSIPGNGVAPSPTPRCSSFLKGSIRQRSPTLLY